MSGASGRAARRPTTPLERRLRWLYRFSTVGVSVTAAAFSAYVVTGGTLSALHLYTSASPVLGLADPVFRCLSAMVEVSICLFAGTLVSLTLRTGANDERTEFVVLLSLVSLGLGASGVRVVGVAMQRLW